QGHQVSVIGLRDPSARGKGINDVLHVRPSLLWGRCGSEVARINISAMTMSISVMPGATRARFCQCPTEYVLSCRALAFPRAESRATAARAADTWGRIS